MAISSIVESSGIAEKSKLNVVTVGPFEAGGAEKANLPVSFKYSKWLVIAPVALVGYAV